MSDVRDPDTDQDAPIPNDDSPFMQDLVIADVEERKQFGIRKYGVALQAGNGRRMDRDAYEEVLDLAVYLRGLIYERENGVGFDYEALDRNPPLAVSQLIERAPLTVRILFVSLLRSVAAQIHDGATDDRMQMFWECGLSEWLKEQAEVLENLPPEPTG